MAKIGLVTLDLNSFINQENFKKDLLLFDNIEICPPSDYTEDILKLIGHHTLFKERMSEWESLLKLGLITESKEIKIDDSALLNEDKRIATLTERLFLMRRALSAWEAVDFKSADLQKIETLVKLFNVDSVASQLVTRSISSEKNYWSEKDEYIPIIRKELSSVNAEPEVAKKTKVINIIINKLPNIDDSISLSQLIEIKNDGDFKLKYFAFRDFINTLSASNLSIKEIDEKIEFLLMDYQKQLDIHNAKYQVTTLETIFVSSAEIIENLIKLKFGQVAKNLISIKNKEVQLLEAESKLPGKEIAILHEILKMGN
jgi:hypothetical protein